MYPTSYLFGLNQFKSGAWFEVSEIDRISWALKLLDIRPNDYCVDIGSGDGRIVVAMAMLGAHVEGIEINPKLVNQSNQVINSIKLNHQPKILKMDMRQKSYHPYNKVFLYQFKTVMLEMEQKLLHELPSGSKVVSNYWQFPHWQLSDRIRDVYLYIKL